MCACAIMCFAACGGNESNESSKTESSSPAISTESSESDDGEQEYCAVSFDTDGGNAIESVTVEKGEKLVKPQNPTKSSAEYEYEFLGWYYGEKEWDFEKDAVTEDMTLTAKWKEAEGYTKPFLPKN